MKVRLCQSTSTPPKKKPRSTLAHAAKAAMSPKTAIRQLFPLIYMKKNMHEK